jgi:putative PIN family toxin of toxin-antitoxin system
MRLVLDTDVVVAAMRSDQGASRQLLLAALERRIIMPASVPLMLEYEAVLTRPEELNKIGLSSVEINVVLDALASVAEPVPLHFVWRPRFKDPGDEMVLDTAVNGRADRLATFNERHLRDAAMEFGIRTSRPGEVWREIRGAKL